MKISSGEQKKKKKESAFFLFFPLAVYLRTCPLENKILFFGVFGMRGVTPSRARGCYQTLLGGFERNHATL